MFPLSGLPTIFMRGLIKYYVSQKGKPTLLPPKCKPDNINLNVKIYKSLWIGPIMRPCASGWQAGVHAPSWRKPFLGTNVSAPSFPALAPLNLHPQWIIRPALDEAWGSSGFPLKKPKIPQTTRFKDLKYDRLATSAFINWGWVKKKKIYVSCSLPHLQPTNDINIRFLYYVHNLFISLHIGNTFS